MGFWDRLLPGLAVARAAGDFPQTLVPPRSASSGVFGSQFITEETARKSSAKWAAIRLRADLVSTTPLQSKRVLPDGSVQIVTDPGLQLDGIGGPIPLEEWLYSSQSDLDETGNTIGVIEERNPYTGRPTWIRLVPSKSVVVRSRDGQITYHIGSQRYDPFDIWHEKQYTLPGSPVGLSPLGYAAMSLGQNLSALQFGLEYFQTSGLPTVQVKNTERTIEAKAAEVVKARYEATMRERGVLVTGKDWDISISQVNADESQFLATLDASNQDIARFFGVPGDVIDVNASGQHVTYANITQRFVALLVLHMAPAFVRREKKFSRDLLPNKVFAKFDTNALLRLDPTSDAALQAVLVAARIQTPDQARAHYEWSPYTPEQLAQIHDLVAGGLNMPLLPKIPDKPEA
ncbi:MAG: phage portal protein [Acidobacteria bacterium]|nr:phage portal protein [Acidobacteriota bacterium]